MISKSKAAIFRRRRQRQTALEKMTARRRRCNVKNDDDDDPNLGFGTLEAKGHTLFTKILYLFFTLYGKTYIFFSSYMLGGTSFIIKGEGWGGGVKLYAL